MSKRLSKRRLLEILMEMLTSADIQVRRGKLRREHGNAFYDRDPTTGNLINTKIVIDSRNAAVVTIMIHELLHLYVAQQYNLDRLFTEPLEEAVVRGLTSELEDYLHDTKNARLFQSWVRAVEAKLK